MSKPEKRDVVDRLRQWVPPDSVYTATSKLLDEAANEIEALRGKLSNANLDLSNLTVERDKFKDLHEKGAPTHFVTQTFHNQTLMNLKKKIVEVGLDLFERGDLSMKDPQFEGLAALYKEFRSEGVTSPSEDRFR